MQGYVPHSDKPDHLQRNIVFAYKLEYKGELKMGGGIFLVLGILCTILGTAYSLVGWQEGSLLSILSGLVIIILGITIYALGNLIGELVKRG